MADKGMRFSDDNDKTPEAFLDANGKPMFVRLIENFANQGTQFIFIARNEHVQSKMDLFKRLKRNTMQNFIAIENVTEGWLLQVYPWHFRCL